MAKILGLTPFLIIDGGPIECDDRSTTSMEVWQPYENATCESHLSRLRVLKWVGSDKRTPD